MSSQDSAFKKGMTSVRRRRRIRGTGPRISPGAQRITCTKGHGGASKKDMAPADVATASINKLRRDLALTFDRTTLNAAGS